MRSEGEVGVRVSDVHTYHPSAISLARRLRKPRVSLDVGGNDGGGVEGERRGRRRSMEVAASEWNACITSVASRPSYPSIQCTPAGCAARQARKSSHRSSMRIGRGRRERAGRLSAGTASCSAATAIGAHARALPVAATFGTNAVAPSVTRGPCKYSCLSSDSAPSSLAVAHACSALTRR